MKNNFLDLSHLDLSPVPEPIDQIKTEMAKHGLIPPSIVMDGKIHRFAVGGKRNDDSGWYVWHDGVCPAGRFGNWKTGLDITFCVFIGRELSSEEIAFQRSALETARTQRDIERQERARLASLRALQVLEKSELASAEHPYLFNKKILPHGITTSEDGTLIVPVKNSDDKIMSLQFIRPNGEKRFLPGGEIKGGFFSFGIVGKKIFICEGFATGATIFQETGVSTFVAFSAGNLAPVAKELRAKLGHVDIVIISDHDENGVGQKAAREASESVGASVVMSPVLGQDINDYFLDGGNVEKLLIPEESKWLISAEDMCKQPAPLKWFIKKWIPQKSLIMIHGQSGSGKSFFVLDMMLNIASYKDSWNGLKVRGCPVVYLAGEGQHGIRARMAAWKQKFKPENDIKMWVSSTGSKLDDPSRFAQIVAEIRKLPVKPSIIVVDTLHRFLTGDENSAKDAGAMTTACAELQSIFDATVILVHHTGNSEDAQKRARGSSAWRGDLDVEINVKAPKKNKSTMTIEQMKIKDGEEAEPLYLDREQVTIEGWFDEDGQPVTSLVLVGSEDDKEEEFVFVDHNIVYDYHKFSGGKIDGTGRKYFNENDILNYHINEGKSYESIKKSMDKKTVENPIYKAIDIGILTKNQKTFFIVDKMADKGS